MMMWVRSTNKSRRAETNHYCRAEGEDMDNDDDNDIIEGMSDILITLLPALLLLLLTVK